MSFYPKFDKGLILKGYMLDALRDNPCNFVDALFADMGDGIITGCDIKISGDTFTVSSGIIKIGGQIYVFPCSRQQERFMNGEHVYVYVSVTKAETADGTKSDLTIVQKKEQDIELFELFRYFKDAQMLYYDDFRSALNSDMPNRVIRRYSMKSVLGGSTLCDEYYRLFAKYVLDDENANARDVGFAYACLNGLSSADVIRAYFNSNEIDSENILALMRSKEFKQICVPENRPKKGTEYSITIC